MKSELRQRSNSGVRASKWTAGIEKIKTRRQSSHDHNLPIPGDEYRQPFRSYKPGAGIGWTEPRMESFIGMVDIRKRLPGYVGGVKLRDSVFGNESRI